MSDEDEAVLKAADEWQHARQHCLKDEPMFTASLYNAVLARRKTSDPRVGTVECWIAGKFLRSHLPKENHDLAKDLLSKLDAIEG